MRLSWRTLLVAIPLTFLVTISAPAQQNLPGGLNPQADEDETTAQEGRISVTEPVPDEQLEERLRRVFSEVEAFRKITVEVRSGVVSLGGTTLRAEAAERVMAVVQRFEGVVYVENEIGTERGVETRLAPAVRAMQEFVDRTVDALPLVGVALLVVLLFFLLARLVWLWQAPYERLGVNPFVHGWLRRILWTVVVLTGIIIALNIVDATTLVGLIVGTAGIAGLALGFAFKDIAENYLAGALLSFRQPFAANDLVKIDAYEGKVIRLTAREVVLITMEGNHVSMPNGTVFKSVVTNFTRNPHRRFDVVVAIGTEEDPREAVTIGVEALNALAGVVEEPEPFALVEEIGDSRLVVRFYGWIDQRNVDFLKVRSKAVRVIKTAMDQAGIDLPEPIYAINMHHEQKRPAEKEPGPEERVAAARRSAETANRDTDISVDPYLDEQIEEDRRNSDEENLLQE